MVRVYFELLKINSYFVPIEHSINLCIMFNYFQSFIDLYCLSKFSSHFVFPILLNEI